MRLSKLFDQVYFNTYGVISVSICNWAIIFLLSYYYGIEQLGNYSYVLALISPLALFFNFQIRNYYNTNTYLKNISSFNKPRIIGFVFFTFLCSIIVYFLEHKYRIYLYTIFIIKTAEMFSEYVFASKQKESKIKYIGITLMIRSLLVIIAITLLSATGYSITSFLISISLIYILVTCINLLNIKNEILKSHNEKIHISPLLQLSLSALIISFNINVPKYLLEFFYSSKEVGLFTTHFMFYGVGMVLINSVIQVLINRYSHLAKDHHLFKKSYIKSVIKILFFSVPFLAATFLLGKPFYNFIFSHKYADFSYFIFYVALITPLGALATLSNYKLMAIQKYKALTLNQILILLLHLALASFFISSMKIEGAFIALAISLIFHFLINSIYIVRFKNHG